MPCECSGKKMMKISNCSNGPKPRHTAHMLRSSKSRKPLPKCTDRARSKVEERNATHPPTPHPAAGAEGDEANKAAVRHCRLRAGPILPVTMTGGENHPRNAGIEPTNQNICKTRVRRPESSLASLAKQHSFFYDTTSGYSGSENPLS